MPSIFYLDERNGSREKNGSLEKAGWTSVIHHSCVQHYYDLSYMQVTVMGKCQMGEINAMKLFNFMR